MAVQIPWLLLCVCSVPLFMIYTKSKRIDAREMHEVQMRIKYHSEYWKRGNRFVKDMQSRMAEQLASTEDPLRGTEALAVAAQPSTQARRWLIV